MYVCTQSMFLLIGRETGSDFLHSVRCPAPKRYPDARHAKAMAPLRHVRFYCDDSDTDTIELEEGRMGMGVNNGQAARKVGFREKGLIFESAVYVPAPVSGQKGWISHLHSGHALDKRALLTLTCRVVAATVAIAVAPERLLKDTRAKSSEAQSLLTRITGCGFDESQREGHAYYCGNGTRISSTTTPFSAMPFVTERDFNSIEALEHASGTRRGPLQRLVNVNLHQIQLSYAVCPFRFDQCDIRIATLALQVHLRLTQSESERTPMERRNRLELNGGRVDARIDPRLFKKKTRRTYYGISRVGNCLYEEHGHACQCHKMGVKAPQRQDHTGTWRYSGVFRPRRLTSINYNAYDDVDALSALLFMITCGFLKGWTRQSVTSRTP
ncbi:hypothetical protein ALC53_04106 [Atta colombica]|uniref:Uncharacterized protein n=1 Tax=Atta colombica TaxID=520822 RepID=A0A195BMP6_9HYME|nr:hypothetical protein ALC53_04106 [Atta colombica]